MFCFFDLAQDLDDLKRQVAQMQEEAERLDEIQKEVEAQMSGAAGTGRFPFCETFGQLSFLILYSSD